MKLKRLELYGFKSFAERTSFEFEDSLSALVGPNGSGKSNVADAIRWVLGERSAQKLRGAEMANVVFEGSKSRKPLNFAEVTLVIDNADGWLPIDYEEVSIRRRVDRTGQSEYRLNGEKCRLKDIHGLLLDTGVGTSSYSFIEQGQIDRILRASPRERRQAFEEAAGINRFLDRKREAERRLARVAENLARVGDIVEEVQRQLRSVKYQAGRARTFKRQADRLLRLRLAHAMHACRQLEADRDEHARAIEQAEAERARLSDQAGAAEQELEAARAARQSRQRELADSRERLTRIDARLESLARESELNRRRGREIQEQLQELQRRRQTVQERAGKLEEEADAAAAQLASTESRLSARTADFEAGQRRLEKTRRQCRAIQERIETKKAETFDLFQQEAHLRNQIEVLAAERRALQNRLDRVRNRQAELARQIDQSEGERGRTHERLEELNARKADLDSRLERIEKAIEEARGRLSRLAEQVSETKAELRGQRERRDVLRDLQERAEGVRSGVRRLLEADLPGTVGIVADLIEVPLEHAAAVEAALGDRVQAVIYERGAEARQALQALSQQEVGRAELLVLEQAEVRSPVQLGGAGGPVGRLSELVRCDEQVRKAVELLLGNAFLVEDADAALALAEAGLPEGATLVTPAGERFDADGLWAGGTPETPSLVSRRSELSELDVRVRELDQQLASLAVQREHCAEQTRRLQAERDGLASRLESLRQDAGEVRSHLQVVQSRADELREELHLARAEQTALTGDVDDLGEQSAQLNGQSEQIRHDRAEAQKAVEAEGERLRAMQACQQELTEQVAALGSELARAREQQRSLHSLSERLDADRRQAEAELASMTREQESSSRRSREAADAVASARAEMERLEGEKTRLGQELETEGAALEDLHAKIEELARQSKELAGQREELEERLHGVRLAQSQTAVKLEDLIERIAEDCGVRLRRFQMEPDRWQEGPPFTVKVIREFADEPPPQQRVAAWYRESPSEEDSEEEEAPEVVTLEEAVRLRQAVLELADDPATDWAAVKQETTRLKAKVDRVGNVNVAAIRQQEELEVRLQFLTDQKEDLEKARRHQHEIIRKLSRKSRERFRESFEQVRENFHGLFRKLFGGGAADILLDEEEEDILEAGIEIVARPPGKETTSISLLSGGERALTTVALLFAMFQAKPSPFCLLDEVDAPLDDANVERFLMLLEEFRHDTQFIIITHNKLTMSVAQVLYGLTMADGVSKKISVKFEQVDRQLGESPAPRAKAG
ncbi:MAG: chromosome segregation protein SMC [Planctomycetota bacterium]